MVSFLANMEPPDEGTTRRPRAMTEMIFLAIVLLVGMMTVPCFRASVVQRRIAFEGFPLACLVLLTSVLVTLASTSTFPILSVPHVPFVTILPPAPRSSTPCMPLTCPSLPEMYQTGIPHVKELHGTCNRSSGESWDLKNFAVAEMPLFVPVRDDLDMEPALRGRSNNMACEHRLASSHTAASADVQACSMSVP